MNTNNFKHRLKIGSRISYLFSAAALALVLAAGFEAGRTTAAAPAPEIFVADAVASAPAAQAQGSYADVVGRVTPAVVTIRASRVRKESAEAIPFLDDPAFRDLFGDRLRRQTPQGQERIERGLGSGVIVSADGYILTNHHVVEGAEDIRIELSDGRTLRAKVVGSDQPSDLAVLKVEAAGLPVLPLGDSDKSRVGDVVLAVGNPLGVGQTVTSGIISAKGRTTGLSDGSFEDFIQTDAAINRGNSGGALVNTAGELIGINSQIWSPTGGSVGIGFAVPSNMARSVMEQLRTSGRVRRGQLGIVVQKIDADLASGLGLNEARGLIVSSVRPGSAAERAGVRRNDVVLSFNGQPATDPNTFRNRVASTAPGAEVTLVLLRDNREQTVRVALGEFVAEGAKPDESAGDGARTAGGAGRLGITVGPLTPELVERLQLPAGTQGLIVSEIDPSGPAALAGLQPRDVIMEVNRQSVRTSEDLRAAVQRAATRPVVLLVARGGDQFFVTVRPRQEAGSRQ